MANGQLFIAHGFATRHHEHTYMKPGAAMRHVPLFGVTFTKIAQKLLSGSHPLFEFHWKILQNAIIQAKMRQALESHFGKTTIDGELKIIPGNSKESRCPCRILSGTKASEAVSFLKKELSTPALLKAN